MQVGQLAGPRDRFCPVGAVTKWPYRHLYDKEESEKVSMKYFAAGQFRSRGWTMYVDEVLLHCVFFSPRIPHPRPHPPLRTSFFRLFTSYASLFVLHVPLFSK